jgi:hypothetical protein
MRRRGREGMRLAEFRSCHPHITSGLMSAIAASVEELRSTLFRGSHPWPGRACPVYEIAWPPLVISHDGLTDALIKSNVYSCGSRFSGFFRESSLYFRNDPYFSLDNYGSSQ